MSQVPTSHPKILGNQTAKATDSLNSGLTALIVLIVGVVWGSAILMTVLHAESGGPFGVILTFCIANLPLVASIKMARKVRERLLSAGEGGGLATFVFATGKVLFVLASCVWAGVLITVIVK
jgi:hypothetical protein